MCTSRSLLNSLGESARAAGRCHSTAEGWGRERQCWGGSAEAGSLGRCGLEGKDWARVGLQVELGIGWAGRAGLGWAPWARLRNAKTERAGLSGLVGLGARAGLGGLRRSWATNFQLSEPLEKKR